MGEVELDLGDAMPGAHGVDRHPDLHAEAVRERQHVLEHAARNARCPEIGARSRRPQRRRIAQRAKPTREAEPAADARGEDRDRHVRLAAPHGLGERAQPARGLAEVAVAEDEDRCSWSRRAPGARERRCASASRAAERGGAALADHPLAAHHPRAGRARAISGVASVEPSSATHTGAPGKARASAASVASMRAASL